jgi:hypothetical protein
MEREVSIGMALTGVVRRNDGKRSDTRDGIDSGTGKK